MHVHTTLCKRIYGAISILVVIGLFGLAHPLPLDYPSLRAAADERGIHLGATDAGFGSALYENTYPYAFNSLTPESVMKFENIHPCPPRWLIDQNESVRTWVIGHGQDRPQEELHCSLEDAVGDEWHWERVDRLLAFAEAHGLAMRGHTFLWHSQNPGWLTHEAIRLTVSERQQVMDEHIRGAVAHTCTSPALYAYDVVNEALTPEGELYPSPWTPIPNYIDQAFRAAEHAITDCGRGDIQLYYNDFDFEYGGPKADAIYAYLAGLLQVNDPTPMNGIGFQTHSRWLSPQSPPHEPEALRATLDRLGGPGLETSITETDLPIYADYLPGLYERQGQWLGERLQACLDAENCVGYTLWGTHDGASWRVYFKGDHDPLIFQDANQQIYDPGRKNCRPATAKIAPGARSCPKPAYGWLLEALQR